MVKLPKNSKTLTKRVYQYFNARGLKWPETPDRSLDFLLTELAEAKELLIAAEGGWARNNPDDKPAFDTDALGDELADIVMMAIVTGILIDVDIMIALGKKMDRKLKEAA